MIIREPSDLHLGVVLGPRLEFNLGRKKPSFAIK
jgi:hypothetical protein